MRTVPWAGLWLVLHISSSAPAAADELRRYPWLGLDQAGQRIAERITVPAGFQRVAVRPGGFADWLRHLPLKPPGAPVRLHDGRLKARQDVHAAVVEIDVGVKDLQQCADAVIRLRAEYLYSVKQVRAIHFDFTSGDRIDFARWIEGWRPTVAGNKVGWRQHGERGASHAALQRYLETIFIYAGSYSLAREMVRVEAPAEIAIGDVFLEGGFPGHAVIVVDLARHPADGRRIFLLAQSYMPAQEVHVLRNPRRPELDPWYLLTTEPELATPEWRFDRKALYRFEAKPGSEPSRSRINLARPAPPAARAK